MNIESFDLNLLRVLDALFKEGNVTRAADRLGMTQPAVSRSLQRLRDGLGDALFVRGRGGMVPTVRAEEMREPVRRILNEIESALFAEDSPDLSEVSRSFTIVGADYCDVVVLPNLLKSLRKMAPGIEVKLLPFAEDILGFLESGEVDFVIKPRLKLPETCRQRHLFDEGFSCLASEDHPRIRRSLDLDSFCSCHHLHITMLPVGRKMRSFVDIALDQLGRKRHIALTISRFFTAPQIIAETDLIVTLPNRVAKFAAERFPVRVFEPPIELPTFPFSLVWHPRVQHDPIHAFLREQIVASVK